MKALQGFGGGSGKVWIENVGCFGTEQRLEDCGHNGFGNHNCDHEEDAGVICISGKTLNISFNLYSHPLLNTDEEVVCNFKYETQLEDPPMCDESYGQSGPSEACIHRYASITHNTACYLCLLFQQVWNTCSILSNQFSNTL